VLHVTPLILNDNNNVPYSFLAEMCTLVKKKKKKYCTVTSRSEKEKKEKMCNSKPHFFFYLLYKPIQCKYHLIAVCTYVLYIQVCTTHKSEPYLKELNLDDVTLIPLYYVLCLDNLVQQAYQFLF
jgi:hypothetical protein